MMAIGVLKGASRPLNLSLGRMKGDYAIFIEF